MLQVCTHVTEKLHSFLSQSELSNFFVYIIRVLYQLLFKLTCSKYFITLVLNSASFTNLMLLCCLFLFQVLVAVFPGEYERRLRRTESIVPTQMKYFETGIKSWKPFPSMARLADVTECTCAEVVGNYLYVANETVGSSVIFRRYHTASNVWEKLPPLVSSTYSLERIRCLCTVNEHVYAFRDSDLAQRYSLPQNDWQGGIELPSLNKKGHRKRSVFVTAVSMKSKIYVLRGYYSCRVNADNHGYKEKPAVFHCFDPQKNEWKKRASTVHPHFESTLFVENNTLYVAGGTVSVNGARAVGGPAPVEVYNEKSNSWHVVEQKHIPSNNLGAVELLGGKVYFIINKFPIDSGIRIPPNEVYTISLGQWEHLGTIDDAAVLCYLSVKKEMLNTQ